MVAISNNHKNTSPSFSECISILYNNYSNEIHNPLISKNVYDIVNENKEKLNDIIDYNRDFLIDYFGFKTLEKSYLFRIEDKIIERPQHLLMRVAIGIHGNDIKNVNLTYEYMSQQYFIHATPTLFHSGTDNPQLLSCFLLGMGDSVDSMYKTIGDCAQISKWAGGIGIWLHDIRSKNSLIRSTNGKSNGLMPLLKVLNATATHINQSGRRNGSFACYLELWHADIITFLDAGKNHGDEQDRARELFYALWINDLFMEKVEKNEMWYLLCPDKCKNLTNTYGEKFNELYNKYSQDESLVCDTIEARKLWEKIIVTQIETGGPYLLYKDHANKKSNQQNLGVIKSSNLCTEIMEYSSTEEYACCTLASIGLPKFVIPFNFTNISNVIVYSKKDCVFCDYSKKYLLANNIPFIEKLFTKESIEELEEKLPEYTSYPQIFVSLNTDEISIKNEIYIGGLNELITYFKPTYDFNRLYNITKLITLNLNRIIDNNFYPVPETRYSNKLHRPLGIGVQGLADVYSLFNLSFDDAEAYNLNKQIFATIYYASLETSMEISRDRKSSMKLIKKYRNEFGPTSKEIIKANEYLKKKKEHIWYRGDINSIDFSNLDSSLVPKQNIDSSVKNKITKLHNELLPIDEELFRKNEDYLGAYSSFEGSPLSKGLFQFDLWEKKPLECVPGLVFK